MFEETPPRNRIKRYLHYCTNRWIDADNRISNWCWFKLVRFFQILYYRRR